MPKAHPLFLEIAALLRELARDPETVWSYYAHAEEEMSKAIPVLDHNDAVFVLQNGKITGGETQGELWARRYRIEDISDGGHVAFVVSFSVEEKLIEIITAFRLNE